MIYLFDWLSLTDLQCLLYEALSTVNLLKRFFVTGECITKNELPTEFYHIFSESHQLTFNKVLTNEL
jgi:hypothetical protein